MNRTYQTKAIIIKRFNFGEADKILTLYTPDYGKIHCLAKGIRKTISRKAASLELFNLASIFTVKGKNLDLITEAYIIDSFLDWRKNLNKVALAFQFCELCDRLSAENQENQSIFELLVNSLEKLRTDDLNLKGLSDGFKKKILELTGFGLPAVCDNKNLSFYIEEIIEKKINSDLFLRKALLLE